MTQKQTQKQPQTQAQTQTQTHIQTEKKDYINIKNTLMQTERQLGPYLAGLIEGDGYILLRKGKL